MQQPTKIQCPNCEAVLKAKFMAAHLEDRHDYLPGSAAYAATK
jgi:ribosomal protein S27AE